MSNFENGTYRMGGEYGMPFYTIPEHMLESIRAYVMLGQEVGEFLQAVISNDLKEAFGRADENNQRNMMAYVDYFYNQTPSTCWGSREAYESWIARRQAEGPIPSQERA